MGDFAVFIVIFCVNNRKNFGLFRRGTRQKSCPRQLNHTVLVHGPVTRAAWINWTLRDFFYKTSSSCLYGSCRCFHSHRWQVIGSPYLSLVLSLVFPSLSGALGNFSLFPNVHTSLQRRKQLLRAKKRHSSKIERHWKWNSPKVNLKNAEHTPFLNQCSVHADKQHTSPGRVHVSLGINFYSKNSQSGKFLL